MKHRLTLLGILALILATSPVMADRDSDDSPKRDEISSPLKSDQVSDDRGDDDKAGVSDDSPKPATGAKPIKKVESVNIPVSAPTPKSGYKEEPEGSSGRPEELHWPRGERRGRPGPGWHRPPRTHRPPHHRWRGRGWYDHSWHHWHFHYWSHVVFVPYPVWVPRHEYAPRRGRGVQVQSTTSDQLGMSFAAALREELPYVDLRPVYTSDRATLQVFVAGLEQFPEDPGAAASVAVTYVWMPGNRFITTQLLAVTPSDLGRLAASVADYADDLIGSYWY